MFALSSPGRDVPAVANMGPTFAGSHGGGHRHMASVATPIQSGGSNSSTGAELPIIELVGERQR